MKQKSCFSSLIPMHFGIIIIFTVLLNSCSEDPTKPTSSVPELTTASVSTITSSTATCGGTITSENGASIIVRGVCWSTSQTPTVSNNKTNDGGGSGNFTSEMSGLTPETTYYTRAYATNSAGTGYGSTMSFTTYEAGTIGMVTDIDGNVYQIVKISNQWWMAENLKVTHYRNGEAIPTITNNSEWAGFRSSAYCIYNNDNINIETYGLLYNWFAVNESRGLAPVGWHIPTDEEWKELEMYLGMSQSEADNDYSWRGTDEGGKLKETGTSHWNSPNDGATNESGFSALPGGFRSYGVGTYSNIGDNAYFWLSTEKENSDYNSWARELGNYTSKIFRIDHGRVNGFSVRCVRN